MKLSRNDPCHCGSGKKYKHCHLREDQEAEAIGVDPTAPAVRKPLGPWPYILGGAGIFVSIAVGITSTVGNALVVAAAWALAFAAYMVFRDPPPPREDAGNPAALDFGMAAEEKRKKKR